MQKIVEFYLKFGGNCFIIDYSHEGREEIVTHVEVKDGNIEGALKRVKMKVQRSGIPTEMKKRREYSKPGIVRREAKKEAIRNAKKHNKQRY